MRKFNLRFLNTEDLLTKNNFGKLYLSKGFTEAEIEGNEHVLMEDTNLILQINTNYQKIDCHDLPNKAYAPIEVEDEGMIDMIKHLVEKAISFKVVTYDNDDVHADYYYDMGLLSRGYLTKEDYLLNIEKHEDRFAPEICYLNIETDKYKVLFYRNLITVSLKTSFKYVKTSDSAIEVLEMLYNTVGNLKPIKMNEKEKVAVPLSKFHIVMGYLKENKANLPKEVVDALETSDLEEVLTHLADENKDKEVYTAS